MLPQCAFPLWLFGCGIFGLLFVGQNVINEINLSLLSQQMISIVLLLTKWNYVLLRKKKKRSVISKCGEALISSQLTHTKNRIDAWRDRCSTCTNQLRINFMAKNGCIDSLFCVSELGRDERFSGCRNCTLFLVSINWARFYETPTQMMSYQRFDLEMWANVYFSNQPTNQFVHLLRTYNIQCSTNHYDFHQNSQTYHISA